MISFITSPWHFITSAGIFVQHLLGNSINPWKYYRAVYTGIKKPEFFSHSSFFVEVARQLALYKHCKKPTSEEWFFETPPFFHCFFANVNARSRLAGIIQVFGHMGRDHPTADHPRPAMYCALRTVKGREKSCMRTSYPPPQKKCEILFFFAHALFLPKPRKFIGFSGSVNGTTKNLWFLPM